jgi:molybdopterin converting factor small subunit
MAETITVTVRLFAALKKFLPRGSESGVVLELPLGSTVQDAIDALGIPSDHAGMLVSKDEYIEADSPLSDGQELSVFPPLAGGVV